MIPYLNFDNPSEVRLGNVSIGEVYIGDNNVWPSITFNGKFYAEYSDSSTYEIECDSTSAITSGEVHTTKYGQMTSAVIGDCVTSIGDGAFRFCSNLTSVTIPKTVTSIGSSAFTICSSLTSIDIPNSVTSIGSYGFYQCSGLTSVTIPSGLTTIREWTFGSCTSLTSIEIPSGVTSIGAFAFGICSGLTAITVNATTPPSGVASNTFYNTNNCPIYVPCGTVDAYKTASGWSTFASRIQERPHCGEFKLQATYSDSTTLELECDSTSVITRGEVQAHSTPRSAMTSAIIGCVDTIGDDAFEGCHSLSSVTLPSNLITIGKGAFTDCYELDNIIIPSGVTSIDEFSFAACSGLTSINIPSGVTSIGKWAFHHCSSLRDIVIPSGVTSIGAFAFSVCSGLTAITVEATTPPTLLKEDGEYATFSNTNCPIYVPSASVEAYKAANGWSAYADRIFPII